MCRYGSTAARKARCTPGHAEAEAMESLRQGASCGASALHPRWAHLGLVQHYCKAFASLEID